MKNSYEEYYLMHKDIPVCLLEISDDGHDSFGELTINPNEDRASMSCLPPDCTSSWGTTIIQHIFL